MTKLKLLHAFTILSVLAATQAQAHGIEGREVTAPRRSAACMTDHVPSVCGESMRVHGGSKTHDDWPANMILG
jgi:hypothetical protein